MPATLENLIATPLIDYDRLGHEIDDVELQRQSKIKLVADGIAAALEVPQRLRSHWQLFLNEDASHLHELREKWFHHIEINLNLIRRIMSVLPAATRLAGGPLTGSSHLARVLQEVEEYRELFAERWQTEDDAAAMIATERTPLTRKQIDALAAQYRPPQIWYEQAQEKPF